MIRFGRGTCNVLWIKDCKSVAEFLSSENDRQRRKGVSNIKSRLIGPLSAFQTAERTSVYSTKSVIIQLIISYFI
jgi:hypothetical protein